MTASGRFLLRIPSRLHERLRGAARRQELSLNQLCERLLERALQEDVSPSGLRPGPWRTLIERLATHFSQELLGVVLFGSVARGQARAGSDVDLLIVLNDERRIERSLYREWETEIRCEERLGVCETIPGPSQAPRGRPGCKEQRRRNTGSISRRGDAADGLAPQAWRREGVVSQTLSPQFVALPASVKWAGGIWWEVAHEGIVLWERGFRVSGFLRELREEILSGRVKRQRIYGHPYWIRKSHARI